MKPERRFAKRGVDATIGYVLLQKVLKETARGLSRRVLARPKREVNWDRIATAEKQLVVGLAKKLCAPHARRRQQYQAAPIHQPGRVAHDLLQLRIAAHKIVSVNIGEYALLSH